MDRLRELEGRLREAQIEVHAKREMLRSWRARNPNANTWWSALGGLFVGLIVASLV